jgi:hypothetical protein
MTLDANSSTCACAHGGGVGRQRMEVGQWDGSPDDDVVCGLSESFLGGHRRRSDTKSRSRSEADSLSPSRLPTRNSVSRMALASPNIVGTDTLQCEPVCYTFVDDATQPLGQRNAGIAGGQWRQARQPLRDLASASQ